MRVLQVGCVILVFALCGAASADHATQAGADELWSRWHDVDFEYSVGYADYQANRVPYNTEIGSVLPFPCPLQGESAGRVAIVVNSNLYPLIEDQLIVWVSDINADGFEALLVEATFENVQDLRAALNAAWRSEEGLVGCILVGDFPVPWYGIFDDQGKLDDFPCDLYYEDLDGEFIDSDSDGMFDGHVDGEGNTSPDIWLGRVLASPMSGNEAGLVRRYLARNHQYRLGEVEAPDRALLFIDDDWADLAVQWEDALGWLYDDIKTITDHERTNAEEYLKRLHDGYEWVDVMVHSDPSAHYFSYRGVYSMLYNSELRTAAMNCLFYVPFSCSNSRYVEPDYMGGWYIFGENSLGLSVIGSTKSGSIYYGDEMYKKLSEGECLGEAFRSWFVQQAPYSDDDVEWFYGLTFLGDPTLRPPDTAPPQPPTYFHSEPTDEGDGLRLLWEPPDAADLAGYRLYYDTEGVYPPFDGKGLPQGDSPIAVGLATSFTIRYEDMMQFNEIHWVVTAFDVRGNESGYSEPLDSSGNPELDPPQISWIWWDPSSHVSHGDGGYLHLWAYVVDGEDLAGTLDVELLLDGQPTGIKLLDDGLSDDFWAGDSFYAKEIQIPAGLLSAGRYLVSVVATDSDGNHADEWPYLTISQKDKGQRTKDKGKDESGRMKGALANDSSFILHPSTFQSQGPTIVGSAVVCVDEPPLEPYLSMAMTVYHPVSKDDITELQLYYNQQPTGIFFDRYPEYDSDTEAYFWTWFYMSDYGVGPGRYLLEAVAEDASGNESDMFPYLWVD
ncbi:MAG: hypothetical protein JW759_01725 [Candidatus Coatesbacteria bacterium]|nr:hypothetical protein [Candidatus Coatesbacteria bacterium]